MDVSPISYQRNGFPQIIKTQYFKKNSNNSLLIFPLKIEIYQLIAEQLLTPCIIREIYA